MTPTQRTILGIYAALIAIWPIRHLVLTWAFPKLDYLDPGSPRFDAADPPLVSAIIPAKDEEATLADCLASVRSQSYPNLEILVVDDRSDDRTPEIARAIAEADPRVRLISIDEPARRAGPARRTPCTSPPARPGASGSGSSTPTPATSPTACRSSWNTPGRTTRRWPASCPRCGARASGSRSCSPWPGSS